MKVGVPKEIKNNENRVGMTPSGVAELVNRGHIVYVQHTAGEGSGFSDEAYTKVGAQILPTIEDVYAQADMIVKVKEPIASEYSLVRKDQVVFTYFHFACEEELTHAMLKSGAVCIAYETVERADRSLPLLIPMSEVAGRMAAQNGAYYLQKTQGGKGKLMAGVPGVKPARVLVLGGGTVGEAAARIAAGMGADVTITDVSLPRLKQLAAEMPANVHTLYSSVHNIRQELPTTDIVIGSVLIPGDAAPKLITRDMLALMEPGSVLVDVAIDLLPSTKVVVSRLLILPRIAIPSIPLTASSTMLLLTSPVLFPIPPPSPSPTPPSVMSLLWLTRDGSRPVVTTSLCSVV